MAFTRRPLMAAAITAASCAASKTTTSRSSPTNQMLLVTSHSPPSRAKMPSVVTSSIVTVSTSQNHDAAQHFATLHPVERLLDRVERDGLTDELVERQPTLLMQRDQHREVARREAVAVPRRLQCTASTEHLDERKF